MLVHMKVTIEDREARTLTADIPLAPQAPDEETLRRMQQAGRIELEHGLDRAVVQARQPCCYGRHCFTRPLAKRTCQLATTKHCTRRPQLPIQKSGWRRP